MSWFQKLLPSKIRSRSGSRKKGVPEGLWTPCPACNAVLYRSELERNLMVCPKCEHHMRLSARQRLDLFLDEDQERVELGSEILARDFLKFKDTKRYKDRLHDAQKTTGETEALLAMWGSVKGQPLVAMAFDFAFIGGSMGSAVGARFVRGIETAIERSAPVVVFCTSGGARMQEGLVSLFQMSKTAAALAVLAEHRLPYISVFCDPTFGGVSASLAFLGDVHMAEPGAVIGFAGPRVIQQVVRTVLPEGFQRADFLMSHGFMDMIVDRRDLKDKISELLLKFTFH